MLRLERQRLAARASGLEHRARRRLSLYPHAPVVYNQRREQKKPDVAITALLVLALQTAQDPKKEKPRLEITGYYPFGGSCRDEHVTPVRLLIKNPLKEPVDAVVRLAWALPGPNQPKDLSWGNLNDRQGAVVEFPAALPEYSQRQYTVMVEPFRPRDYHLWAFLMVDDQTRAAFEVNGAPIPRLATAVGVVGTPGPLGIPRPRSGGDVADPYDAAVEILFIKPEDLPDRWIGLAMVDHLIWLDADPAAARDPAQAEALRLWVAGGGHLMVASDRRDGLEKTFLDPLLPVQPGQTATMPSAQVRGIAVSGPVAVLESKPRPGAVVLDHSGEAPILVERRYGRGRVTFLALSPRQRAFREHPDVERFWTELLRLPTRGVPSGREPFANDPIAETLGNSGMGAWVSNFSGIPPPSLEWSFLLIAVYILLVGPADYVLLRFLNRMHWTWFSFSAYVVGFSAAGLLAGARLADHPAAVREFAVLDFAPAEQVTRGCALIGVNSPVKEIFSLEPQGAGDWFRTLDKSTIDYWGDEADDLSNFQYGMGTIRPAERTTLEGWAFGRGQTRYALRQWCEGGPPAVSASLRRAPDGTLTLDVTNALNRPLGRAFLRMADGVYAVPDIPPGSHRFTLSDEATAKLPEEAPYDWLPITRPPPLRRELKAHPLPRMLDSSDWLGDGRAMLVATENGGTHFPLPARNPARSSMAVVRVFLHVTE
jgi:hypothetical protein